ncbi:MAG: hypothetical protein J6T48_03765 [Bacteroidales bacterium]|nr:hypothetical protein [Bacteroidales bacterium]
MQELSPKKQEAFELIRAKYSKTVIRKGDIYVYDGSILHIVEEKKNGMKVSSVLNLRYWVLLIFLILIGVPFGLIGIAITLLIANLIAIKTKRTKKANLISIIS